MDCKEEMECALRELNDYRLLIFEIDKAKRFHEYSILSVGNAMPLSKLKSTISVVRI